MANDFGVTFAPTGGKEQQQSGDANAPIQEAIRTLSLRIPSVVGTRAPAPSVLLNSMGGGGLANPMGINLERLLAMLFGSGQPASPQGATLQPGTAGFGAGQTSQPGGFPQAPRMPPITDSFEMPTPVNNKPGDPGVRFGQTAPMGGATPLTQAQPQPQSQATQNALSKFSDPYRSDPRF
jgi:hypothetical protein